MDIVKIVSRIDGEDLKQNSYIVSSGNSAILIDAGASVEDVKANLKLFDGRCKLDAIFITHSHFDHIYNLDALINKFGCSVFIHQSGKDYLYDTETNLSYMCSTPFVIDDKKHIKTFVDGDQFTFGDIDITCYNTPGHSVDCSCFTIGDNMFTGDTIFRAFVGRTDLFSSDENQQRISLLRLRDITDGVDNFYPGHGSNFTKKDLLNNITVHLGE